MRDLAVVTVGRSDYGIYLPLLNHLKACEDVRLRLIVGGMHLVPEFGLTVKDITFEISDRVDFLVDTDTPLGVARSMGRAVEGYALALARQKPDILVVLGDRFDMYAAAVAALPLSVPVAHIHGGEITLGAFDDALRHSMTKLSHLHFAATEAYARRLVQLGEEPWRVHRVGAPALDNLADLQPLSLCELEEVVGGTLQPAPLLVTFHPATLDPLPPEEQVGVLIEALETVDRPVVVTLPNADPGHAAIRQRLEEYAARGERRYQVGNLGTRRYFSLMRVSAAMVGNSSSGLIEAPSFGLPVVNVGPRQDGRVRAANVVDVPCRREAIQAALAEAPGRRKELQGLPNPYGDGHASPRIASVLRHVPLDGLTLKRFHDLA